MPATLTSHFSRLKDVSLYLDGTGLVRLAEAFWPSNQWNSAAPLIDVITNRSVGVYAQAKSGAFNIEATNLFENKIRDENRSHSNEEAIELISGDSPLIAQFNFDLTQLREAGTNWFDKSLNALTGGRIDLSFKIPGLNLTAEELVNAPSGNWVFGLGGFNTVTIPPSERLPSGEVLLNPILVSGFGIKNKGNKEEVFYRNGNIQHSFFDSPHERNRGY
jgi:hypothetical protein